MEIGKYFILLLCCHIQLLEFAQLHTKKLSKPQQSGRHDCDDVDSEMHKVNRTHGPNAKNIYII